MFALASTAGAREAGQHSRQYFSDDSTVHVRKPSFDAVVVKREAFVVDAEKVEDGGMEIVPGDGLMHGFPANIVRAAKGHAVLEAGAGEPDGEAVHIVIAAGRF